LVEELIPPPQTMREITVSLSKTHTVPRSLLSAKLSQLKSRGLMDAGLVFIDCNGMLMGYLAQAELDFALHENGILPKGENDSIDLVDGPLAQFVDRTPLTLCAKAPIEYAVEMFGKLGLRYLIVTEEGSGKVVGVVIKKRLVLYLESLHS
jgi:chloride channel 3/4/5